MNKTPQGIIALFISPTDEIIVTTTDFNKISRKSQETWAFARLKQEIAKEFCILDFALSIEPVYMESILSNMQKKGYRIEIIPVGYDKDENND